jgi:hypothetical protein
MTASLPSVVSRRLLRLRGWLRGSWVDRLPLLDRPAGRGDKGPSRRARRHAGRLPRSLGLELLEDRLPPNDLLGPLQALWLQGAPGLPDTLPEETRLVRELGDSQAVAADRGERDAFLAALWRPALATTETEGPAAAMRETPGSGGWSGTADSWPDNGLQDVLTSAALATASPGRPERPPADGAAAGAGQGAGGGGTGTAPTLGGAGGGAAAPSANGPGSALAGLGVPGGAAAAPGAGALTAAAASSGAGVLTGAQGSAPTAHAAPSPAGVLPPIMLAA